MGASRPGSSRAVLVYAMSKWSLVPPDDILQFCDGHRRHPPLRKFTRAKVTRLEDVSDSSHQCDYFGFVHDDRVPFPIVSPRIEAVAYVALHSGEWSA
jgi:hypothetical protein